MSTKHHLADMCTKAITKGRVWEHLLRLSQIINTPTLSGSSNGAPSMGASAFTSSKTFSLVTLVRDMAQPDGAITVAMPTLPCDDAVSVHDAEASSPTRGEVSPVIEQTPPPTDDDVAMDATHRASIEYDETGSRRKFC